MTLRAEDLRKRAFAAAPDGYDRAEVDSFLAEAANVVEDLQRTVERLRDATDGGEPTAAAGAQLASGDMAALAAAIGLGPDAKAPDAGDIGATAAGAAEGALFLAMRMLIEDAGEAEVEERVREELRIEKAERLLAEARKRVAQLTA